MTEQRKKESRCTAVQVNRRAPDFECKITSAHTIHVDPKTGLRWGEGKYPRGYNRKWARRKYANHKLHRQSAVAAARSSKEKK